MDDALLMGGFEGLRDLQCQLQRFFNRDRAAIYLVCQRLALHQF